MDRGTNNLVWYTSVVLMPPPELCVPIVEIKKNHMNPRIKRPPFAHITLLAPFVDSSYFESAAGELREYLQHVEPFEVSIKNIQYWKNKNSCTLFLEPETRKEDALVKLYEGVSGVYPESRDAGNQFEPHIGIGYFKGATAEKEARQYQAQYQDNWKPMSFLAKEIYILSRTSQETPFEVRKIIPFGKNPTEPYWPPIPE